ncbi:MAG: OB-fold domain-containing protein [Candidatus Binatia bacterium]|nr:OB-fold domain-containing protein [Candidatus Binatia bacterium]
MAAKPVREGLFDVDPASGCVSLLGSECNDCTRLAFPATDSCPYCGAESVKVVRLPSRGEVELCTVIRKAPPGYNGPVPYGLAVVRLMEDLLVIAPVETEHVLERGTPLVCALREVGCDEQGAPLFAYCFRAADPPRAEHPTVR